jgi:hypothetical protein
MPILPDSNLSTLDKIRVKVRKLTRSPSVSQLSDAAINDYINTFALYDFPETLRQNYLTTTLTFYTTPYIDAYTTNTTDVGDPLYNFNNKYSAAIGPVYVAGYKMFFSQSRENFFALYPNTSSIASIGTAGNGILTNFTGKLAAKPIERNNVLFSSVDVNNGGLALRDDGAGNLVLPNGTATVPASTINYITGAYVLNFPTAPKINAAINSQTYPYVASKPQGILYYSNTFLLRPIPDQPYPINIEVYRRPTEFTVDTQMPELAEWWQYLAYGAAKKVFEDRMDIESIQMIAPELHRLELALNRRSINQQSPERVSTIYQEQSGIAASESRYY